MPREIEVKFYDIEKDTLREKLKDIGLRRVHEEFLMRRRTFHPVKREKQEWFRVRQEHSRITLCYKCLHSREVDGLEEWETEVKDFDIASEIMIRSGLESTALQENLRETWCNDEIEIVIDTWPALKPYIEIE
jgi:predicted adenylyl cyclase CyaB